MARKSTGKRLRFEIFKRDSFTCQYCGKQPPDVVLVIDHITPVCDGGETVAENLITACETCNQGKAGIPLSRIPVRPDADLLYLETQQEIAELQRFQAAKAAREKAMLSVAHAIQQTWIDYTGLDWHPADRVLLGLLNRYSVQTVDDAVRVTAMKVASGYIDLKRKDGWFAYLVTVARNMEIESQE